MKKQAFSFVFGALATTALAGVLAAERGQAIVPGRYQISACGYDAGGAHAFVVDTATGQVWYDSHANFYEKKSPTTQP